MLRNLLRSKALWALVLPIAVSGLVYAGGPDCHGKGVVAAGKGHGCTLSKNVVKTAKLTDDGAVVTIEGKTSEAVGHIKTHLEAHVKNAKEAGCPGCPLAMENVTVEVTLTDKGGEINAHGSTPEAVKALQEWANNPSCCSSHEGSKA